jgi:hypothetical protein
MAALWQATEHVWRVLGFQVRKKAVIHWHLRLRGSVAWLGLGVVLKRMTCPRQRALLIMLVVPAGTIRSSTQPVASAAASTMTTGSLTSSQGRKSGPTTHEWTTRQGCRLPASRPESVCHLPLEIPHVASIPVARCASCAGWLWGRRSLFTRPTKQMPGSMVTCTLSWLVPTAPVTR